MYECYAKSQYFSYLRADGRIHDGVPETGGWPEGPDLEHRSEHLHLDHLRVRERGHGGLPEAGEPLGELRQRHEAEHPHLHHLQLPAARGM